MSAWIESHQTLRDHPRKDALTEALFAGTVPDDVADFATVGLLHHLWWWALDYARYGDLSSFTDRQIAKGCRWAGTPSVLIDALTRAGFLTEDRMIHDWYDYAGKLIERREKNRERMRQARSDAPREACNARAQHSVDTCEATRPNQTIPTKQNQDQEHAPDLFNDELWIIWPNRHGSKKLGRDRFRALTAPQQKRCLAAAAHFAKAFAAGLVDPQYQPRIENFVGGSKSYYREWADGPPPKYRGNGSAAPRRGLDASLAALQHVYDSYPEETP